MFTLCQFGRLSVCRQFAVLRSIFDARSSKVITSDIVKPVNTTIKFVAAATVLPMVFQEFIVGIVNSFEILRHQINHADLLNTHNKIAGTRAWAYWLQISSLFQRPVKIATLSLILQNCVDQRFGLIIIFWSFSYSRCCIAL